MKTIDELKLLSKPELERIKASVQTSDADSDIKQAYLADIEIALNGGIKYTSKQVHDDIAAGAADTDDITGKRIAVM